MSIKNRLLLALLCSSLLIAGCNDNDKRRVITSDKAAIINTVDPGFAGANLELVDLLNTDTPLTAVEGNYDTNQSDFGLTAHGEYFYRIGKYNIDTVTKYSIRNPEHEIYTYSTIDKSDDTTSNTYTMVFLNDEKAYLIRYASDEIWVVDPSAATEAEFKTGEIDLSDYRRNNTPPGMSDGVIVDGKLYVSLQRLDGWTPTAGESYVAVIDTATDTEIDTRESDSSATLKGIQLESANPQSIIYNPEAGLFVQSIGTWSDDYIGGVEKIDTSDYSTELLIDDDNTTGRISGLAIVNDTLGYIISYTGWQNTSLYSFDPADGSIASSAVSNLAGPELDITSLTVDEDGRLWVSIGDASNPRVEILDTMSDSIVHTLETVMNPGKVVFAEASKTIQD